MVSRDRIILPTSLGVGPALAIDIRGSMYKVEPRVEVEHCTGIEIGLASVASLFSGKI
jgi:hypothetical protein